QDCSMHKLLTMFAIVGVAALLEGCLYYRLAQTYRQLCDESPRITIVELDARDRVLVFDEPTLLDTDVACLMGAAPSIAEVTRLGKQWHYVASPVGPEGSADRAITVDLTFVLEEGRYRLSRATIPAQLEKILSRHLIDQSIEAACNGELDLIRQTARVDLSGIDHASLPDRASVIQLFGPPNGPATADGALSWRYCLGRCAARDDPGMMSNLDVVFDPSGHIERVSADYLQDSADANFTVERAKVTFHGSIAQISLDCGL
ncbi:MAG: hypothetical protein WBM97_13805, partial [Sedimenticolaceae bacterium]